MNFFPFLKKSANENRHPEGWTDIHCHILPGIDDGSPDVTTSVQLIKGLMSLGCDHVIATPHIIGDIYPNNRSTIAESVQLLNRALLKEKIYIRLEFAAEYFLDDYFLELLKSEMPLLIYGNNFILTEFSYAISPGHVEEIIEGIKKKGFTPILAHPERYSYFHQNFKNYHYLKELGFHFQLNLLSLTGYYGKSILNAAKYLIKNRMVEFAASDVHNLNHINALKKAFKYEFVNELLKESNRKLILK